MINDTDICQLIHRGGVYFNVRGTTSEAVYKTVSDSLHLPQKLPSETLYAELCQREELMSTAVGNGIAIPHPRYPLLKNRDDERLIVCFPDRPVSMNAPDFRPVYAMFFLLTASSQSHLKVLSQLAYLFQKTEFRAALEKKPLEPDLLALVKKYLI